MDSIASSRLQNDACKVCHPGTRSVIGSKNRKKFMKIEIEKKKYTVPAIQVVEMSHNANLLDASEQDYDGEFGLLDNDSSKMEA
jgi:hypothetical protein